MKIIIVPKDQKAEHDLDYDRAEDSILLVWALSDDEYMDLDAQGVFGWLNRQCGVLIDEYEDQRIPWDKLLVVRETLAKNANANVVRLSALVNEAITRRTGIWFYF